MIGLRKGQRGWWSNVRSIVHAVSNRLTPTVGVVVGVLLLAMWMRYPFVEYNLPVAAHIDERGSVGILRELRFTSLNPRFFSYPMLYFYSLGGILRFVPFEETLYFGRFLNLIIATLLGLATALLTYQITRSKAATLIATTLAQFSPVLIYNASYISVDTLFVTLTLFALWGWARFFDAPSGKRWLAAAVVTGLAISTKYNAVLLLPAVMVVEMFWGDDVNWRRATINSRWWSGLLLLSGGGLLLVNLIPQAFFLEIVRSEAAVNSGVDSADSQFILSTLRKINVLALLLLGVGVTAFLIEPLSRLATPLTSGLQAALHSLRRWRIYWLLVIVGIVFLAVNPFALIEWRIFLRDFGLELKKNAQTGSQPFWRQYVIWWWQWESATVLLLAMLGVYSLWNRERRSLVLLLVYLLLMLLMIGTATRGFVRYLSPIVPLVALLAGAGTLWLWQRQRLLPVALLLLCAVELTPPINAQIQRANTIDYMHEGFVIARDLQPNTAFAAGFTPIQELRHAGFNYRHVSDDALQTGSFLVEWQDGDLLLVDSAKLEMVDGDFRPIWSSDDHLGLHILELSQSE